MWHSQPENSLTGYAITVGNVIPITSCVKTGADLRSAQKTTNQKNRSLNPYGTEATLLLYTNLGLIGLNLSMFTWERLVTAPFKAWEALMAAPICSPTLRQPILSAKQALAK